MPTVSGFFKLLAAAALVTASVEALTGCLSYKGTAPRRVSVPVSNDWAEVRLVLTSSRGDVDLKAAGARSDSEAWHEELVLSRVRGPYALPAGPLAVEVMGEAVFDLRVEIQPFEFQKLAGSASARLTGLHPFALYEVDGPCRLELACATADVDLVAVPRDSREFRGSTKRTHGLSGYKRLEVSGDCNVMVLGNLDPEEEASVRVSTAGGLYPSADWSRKPLEPVVQILTDESAFGSGAFIDPRGYVLTCFHVIEGPTGEPLAEGKFTLGLTYDAREGAREVLSAKVVRWDKTRDLALLQVTGDLAGHPVAGTFPSYRLGPPLNLRDPLELIGYPGQSWYHKRPGLVVKPGRVAGLEGALIRSDASVAGGFSGGAVVDAQGRLAGIVRGLVGPDAIITGSELVPTEWRELLTD